MLKFILPIRNLNIFDRQLFGFFAMNADRNQVQHSVALVTCLFNRTLLQL